MSLLQELYAQGRMNAGVMFASIPNFLSDFYSEDVNEGMECIRLLNEIIGKFLNITKCSQKYVKNRLLMSIKPTYLVLTSSAIGPKSKLCNLFLILKMMGVI